MNKNKNKLYKGTLYYLSAIIIIAYIGLHVIHILQSIIRNQKSGNNGTYTF